MEEKIFQASVTSTQIKSDFYLAMVAIGWIISKEDALFYRISLWLPIDREEQQAMIRSLCDFLQVKEYTLLSSKSE
ncbi:hypothetical protein [Listeria grayi]|uniref:hypothetical protein n=1 Tax=Listeria grayi TaxID=1641 RepID=UPI00162AF791|nr:hypothetical protein [Listeria grayi]MBC1922997.1 hypothetical protein [Listeria grayi]